MCVHQHGKTPGDVSTGTLGRANVVCLVTAVALVVIALELNSMPSASGTRSGQPSVAAKPIALDPSRFILNALLVPALDVDAVPLRWVDPRPLLRCGPDTTVRVNREPLVAGALVPDKPFELEWQADGCRPFGARGARFEGGVRLTVFREDWGFSAMVEPWSLRIVGAENEITPVQRGAALLPQVVEADEPVELAAVGANR